MRARIAFALAAVALAGCESINASLAPHHEPTDEELWVTRWVGQSESDVLVRYGKPNDSIDLPNGNKLLSYHREMGVASSSATAYGAAYGASSSAKTIFCDRRFELDRTTGKVLRAVIAGSHCDYKL